MKKNDELLKPDAKAEKTKVSSQTLAQFLLRKRYELGLTTEQFAKLLGITRQYLGLLERGKWKTRKISVRLCKKLSDTTGASTNYILGIIAAQNRDRE